MTARIITFSKDRGPQLFSLLASAKNHIKDENEYFVLWCATSDESEEIYDEVIKTFKSDFHFVHEVSFRDDVLKLIEENKNERILFTPDDALWIRDTVIGDMCKYNKNFIPSLRLGKHLTTCHPAGNKEQELPNFVEKEDKHIWRWGDGEYDWGYPLALDTSIFINDEIHEMASAVDFKSPTSFETNIQGFKSRYNNHAGVCYSESRFVSIPWNAVTAEISNLNGLIEPEKFDNMWREGYRIHHELYYNTLPSSAHYEYELKFISRD